ncbi:MAG TPA: TSUP family transporter, partial [Pelobium sp.]|nr:TSUP family transporter [Pelobium sp.]
MNSTTPNIDMKVKGNGNELFPIFLKLQNFQTLLVGGGNVGLEKLSAILNNSPQAKVNIVADRFLDEVKELAATFPSINLFERKFEDRDLQGAELVILATDNQELHQYIRTLAKEKGILVNVADTPDLCDFYLGSIVKKGNLKIAISTNGKSPTVAKRIKEVLNENIPEEIDETLENMSQLRSTLGGDFSDKVRAMNQATAGLIKKQEEKPQLSPFKVSFAIWTMVVLFAALTFYVIWKEEPEFRAYVEGINPQFYWFLTAGFVFAMVDGAIGMSYGVTSTTFSLSMGIPPASASTAVHISEILSNGIAGWMHFKMGNVNKKLFKVLIIPGILGAVGGAFLLSSLEEYNHFTKPLISLYTLILGAVVLKKALSLNKKRVVKKDK